MQKAGFGEQAQIKQVGKADIAHIGKSFDLWIK